MGFTTNHYGQPFELQLFWSERKITRYRIWALRTPIYLLTLTTALSAPVASVAGLVGYLAGSIITGVGLVALGARLLSTAGTVERDDGGADSLRTIACPSCGTDAPAGEVYCTDCGAELRQSTAAD